MSERGERIPRREFATRVGAAGAAVVGVTAAGLLLHNRRRPGPESAPAAALKSFAAPAAPGAPRLAVARGTAVAANLRAALAELGGVERFVQAGDRVVIKPNAAFDRSPALGATTHPDILRALVGLCREAGARRVVVCDNPINNPASCFARTGLRRAAEEAGAEVALPAPRAFSRLRIGGVALHEWECFTGPLLEADKVIGLAPLKDHNLCSASMTMKNWYGLLGGRRNQCHQRIHEVIADFAQLIKPTLVVLDATRILVSNGPTGGSAADVKRGDAVVCGTDMVAVDAYAYEMLLERDVSRLGYIQQAHARGLGDKNWRAAGLREVKTG